MAHSYLTIYVHVVFSTRERRKLIRAEQQQRLWRYLAGIARHHGMKALEIGGAEDHVHLLLSLGSEIPVAKAISILKSNSSKWMREKNPEFGWQEGYAAFSVSAVGFRGGLRLYSGPGESSSQTRFCAGIHRAIEEAQC